MFLEILLSVFSQTWEHICSQSVVTVFGTLTVVFFWAVKSGFVLQSRKTYVEGKSGIHVIDPVLQELRWLIWLGPVFAAATIDYALMASRVPGILLMSICVVQCYKPRITVFEIVLTLLGTGLGIAALSGVLWSIRPTLQEYATQIELAVVCFVLPAGVISSRKNVKKYTKEGTSAATVWLPVTRLLAFSSSVGYFFLTDRYYAALLYVILFGCQLQVLLQFRSKRQPLTIQEVTPQGTKV